MEQKEKEEPRMIKESKILTRDEMNAMLAEGKLLPSEISKIKWERVKAVAECHPYMTSIANEPEGPCALCAVYDGCESSENDEKCPLKEIDGCGHNSTYAKTYNTSTHGEFLVAIDNMIAVLDKAIVIEKKRKEPKADDNMFKGLDENVEQMAYNFDGCIVTIGKTLHEDAFSIDINAGKYDFDTRDFVYTEYQNEKHRIETSCWSMSDWWIPIKFSNDNVGFDFKNGDKFDIAQINTILKHVKGGVDYMKNVKKCKLMTRDEMLTLLETNLPAKVSLMKWEQVLEYVKENKLTDVRSIHEGGSQTCGLCYTYNGCGKCSLTKVGDQCTDTSSSYYNIKHYTGTTEGLCCIILNLIDSLKNAVEYENKPKCEYAKIGKMTLNYTKNGDIYECSIDGMKIAEEIENFSTYWNHTYCRSWGDGEFVLIVNNKEFEFKNISFGSNYPNVSKFYIKVDKLEEFKEALQACSDKLHNLNEPKAEVIRIGKMTVTITPEPDNKVKMVINGMRNYDETPFKYNIYGDVYCYTFHDNTFIIKMLNWIVNSSENASVYGFITTKERSNAIIDALKQCSKILHDINEPKQQECIPPKVALHTSVKEKMKITLTPIETTSDRNIVMEITGMEDPKEFRGSYRGVRAKYDPSDNTIIVVDKNSKYIIPDGCSNVMMWIHVGKNYPMTQEAADEIVTGLKAAAERLHEIRHQE